MTRRLLLTLLLLAVVAPSLGGSVVVVRRAPAPSGFHVEDLFGSSVMGTDWEDYGSWTVSITGGQMTTTAATGAVIYQNDANDTEDGYICAQIVSSEYGGVYFRCDAGATTTCYAVRNEDPSDAIAWRACDVAGCTTITSTSYAMQDSEFLGVTYSGTGDATVVNWFVFDTLVGCYGCDGTTCDTTNWAANADGSGTFITDPDSICVGSGNPRGTCTGSGTMDSELDVGRHVGLYQGDPTASTFDTFYAGDN